MNRMKHLAAVATVALVVAACSGSEDLLDGGGSDTTAGGSETTATTGGGSQLSGSLDGAGATFPNPVYQDWTFIYTNDVQPEVTINYQSIGSGGGIEQFLLQTVDWGTSERYLRDDALAEARASRGCEALQWPVLFGAVEVAFGDDQFDDLVLSGDVVADIFERRITNFSDPAIAELNPDRELPDLDITVVHRSDGSGTTSVFTTYLEADTATWTLGSGTEVQWPAGTIGGQGNEGVTAGIEQNPGGIGYVNQAYALINDLPTARIINSDGNAVKATLEATSEALEVLEIPDSFQFDILGVGGGGYPIVGAVWNFTWECGYDGDTAELLRNYWTWAVSSDEAIEAALELGYAPLGEGLRARVLDAIARTGSLD
ncbi:MAG TPA: phosphate ABC transporter substrate-binding protein PstS [Acidimicrobiia bacterium]|nr:phosphate ABC transporter substrate-binding protein PstS [Acidimicrobiia bacterium]